jgi:solute carrier family 35, member E1
LAGKEVSHISFAFASYHSPQNVGEQTAKALFVQRAGGGGKKSASATTPHYPTTWENIVPRVLVWYGSSVSYGWMTKTLLKEVYYPWSVATFQLMSGLLFQVPLWYLHLHKLPELNWPDIKALLPVALCQLGVHIGATIATGIEQGLPIAHVIKALEPILTLAIDHVFFHRQASAEILLGLIPLVAGVILPYWTTHKLDVYAIVAATIVVVCSSIRVVLIHKILKEKVLGKSLDAKNLFAVLSIMTSLILIPITLQLDGLGMLDAMREKASTGSMSHVTATLLCLSGYLYYLFNETAFALMERMTPTTHAVTNLMRRPMVTFTFFTLNAIHQLCRMVSVKVIPLSFLFWDQSFRETNTVADVFRRQGDVSFMTRIAQPSVDSLLGSFLGVIGCMIYLNEINFDDKEELDDTEVPARKKVRWKMERDQSRLGVPQ